MSNNQTLKKPSIAYLGPQGSFSDICVKQIHEKINFEALKPAESLTEVRKLLVNGEVDFGLFPVENSLGGSVTETLDGLIRERDDLQVKLEWVLQIRHCLIGYGQKDSLKEVRAHYQAFYQCEEFLKINFPNVVKKEFSSNSAAVVSLMGLNDFEKNETAAISSKEASKAYSIPIIQQNINDSENNFTRFWVIGKNDFDLPLESKQKMVSLAFALPRDEPGGLVHVLSSLAKRGVNLTKIESRPTKGRLCEYTFFIDFVGEGPKNEIINEISAKCSFLRFIGNYPVFPDNDSRFPWL
ncbi:MAG: prephenate dehydratase [Candidatus Caenarcaniphilales bacterium]|nr:prephenate dehydratase [Candidatus Caenarcaniphilales bacterium]